MFQSSGVYMNPVFFPHIEQHAHQYSVVFERQARTGIPVATGVDIPLPLREAQVVPVERECAAWSCLANYIQTSAGHAAKLRLTPGPGTVCL
eukprot:9167998-Pyramimonas_sp.AAC.1